MKIKKPFIKHFLALLLCFSILIPVVTVTSQSPSSTEAVTPYSDTPTTIINH